ncbi:hypothetical protein [Paenibacillus tianjinensis]|uniref:Uncharacterized protein n=1 Tax=Paenibacillus tianjinensis TaxID=2810347 RepID=A0ABX7L6U7_9BACL|nr:hypothetical protein [Paenibacillus tianjinensis]QSF43506.1 hypothetical protein JRJ22_19785 [Paenibacillus tianjinensis]
MTKQITVRGLNTEEYAAIKKAAKEEIPFTVCIRICKRKYAEGAIDIRPKTPRGSADPFYKWTEEEFKIVLDFVIRHKLLYATTLITEVKAGTHHDQFGMQFMFWKGGFTFLQFVEGYEPPQAVVTEEVTAVEVMTEEAEMTDTEVCEAPDAVSIALDNKNTKVVHTTEILSNNARHYGFIPDTIDTLIEKMNTYTLDPTFEEYGNFATDFNPKMWTDENKKYKGMTCFFGNFHSLSNVFRIYTNDPEVIDRLTQAIRSNQLTEAYRAARVEIEERKNEWNRIHIDNMNKRVYKAI